MCLQTVIPFAMSVVINYVPNCMAGVCHCICLQVVETLGEPISGHGELTGRGRRREPM